MRNCYLSPNYLSRIFKKILIYNGRIFDKDSDEKAALLLNTHDLKAYQVARKLDFDPLF